MNSQPIQKPVYDELGTLEVHSVFHTIQGEGPFCGRAAVFVRLWGCNLQCPQCDTEYTNTNTAYLPEKLVQKVVELSRQGRTNLVVITGGEPLRQNLFPFVRELIMAGFKVQVETNGTLPLSEGLPLYVQHDICKQGLFVVCSPKTGKVHPMLREYILAYKYVGGEDMMEDGLPRLALGHTAFPHLARPHAGYTGVIYLQPVDAHETSQSLKNQSACVASVLEHGYTLQLQTHKLIGVE